MVRRAPPAAITAALGHMWRTRRRDRESMQRRRAQRETLVGTLRTELDVERSARQKVESTAVIRPVSDGASLKMQSPTGDFAFQVGGPLDVDCAHYNTVDTRGGGVTDVWLSYKGFAPVLLTVGNFKEWFGMEQLTSDNTTLFWNAAADSPRPGAPRGGALSTQESMA